MYNEMITVSFHEIFILVPQSHNRAKRIKEEEKFTLCDCVSECGCGVYGMCICVNSGRIQIVQLLCRQMALESM